MKIAEKILKNKTNEALSRSDVKLYNAVFNAASALERALERASKGSSDANHTKAYKEMLSEFLEWQEDDKKAYSDGMMGIEMDLDDAGLL